MKEIYDIETMINVFTYCGFDPKTLQKSEFIFHENQDDREIFYNHLSLLTGQIGFNNLSFDGQVINYLLLNKKRFLICSIQEVINCIYEFAQKCIYKSNNGSFSEYPEWKLIIPQLDLFKIWHFDNKVKMTSLKWIEYMIDMDSIEEMPIKHDVFVTIEEVREKIIPYNHWDVKATYEFYKITKGETDLPLYRGVNRIELRKNIKQEFGIQCLNYNDVKIGDAINKLSYCELTGLSKKEVPVSSKILPHLTFADCIPDYIVFKTDKFNNFKNSLSKIKLEYNGTTYIIAKGGIHSKDKGRCIEPLDNEILRDADVGSQYPNALRKRNLFPKHLGNKWIQGYISIIQKRLDAKAKYKETKETKYQAIQEAYKLSLNGGGYGKLGEEKSWQYDPEIMYKVTIGNQFEILMLVEMLELEGIHCVSANTDGIVCLFDKSLEETYYRICKEWEIIVGNDTLGQLEYADYALMAQTSVNDYIAIKTNGEVKTKGDFVSDFELHKNKSAVIVPIALQKYFVDKIPIEQTIKECRDIFKFTLGAKSIGQNKLISFNKKTQEEIELQKINRYYISNKGIIILKRLPMLEGKIASGQLDIFGGVDDGTRESRIEAGSLQTIYNIHTNKPFEEYDINYQYYIDRCQSILKKIKI
jgi:hypothetical protein